MVSMYYPAPGQRRPAGTLPQPDRGEQDPNRWHYAGLIDRTRIGMAGHSIGGSATEATMVADQRVLAGVDLDGPFGSAYGAPWARARGCGSPTG